MLGLRFTPDAVEQLSAADEWWRENREKSPNLLAVEIDEVIAMLRASPGAGAAYPNDELADAKRFLMRRTRFHVYYVVRDNTLVIVAVWSAIRGHGPSLAER